VSKLSGVRCTVASVSFFRDCVKLNYIIIKLIFEIQIFIPKNLFII